MGQGHDDDCCCCDHGVCVSAWSIAAICDEVSGDSAPDCSDHAVPGAISGAVVTITRTYTDIDGDHTETVGTCTTGGSGRCCVEIPLGIEDPIPAPTVDPDGGGSSGCLLLPDTYDVRYAYRNAYPLGGGAFGETLASFPSPTFQIGVPDPAKFPSASNLSAGDTGGRVGSLAVGVYWVRHTYANPSGETTSGNPIKIRVGMMDPTPSFDVAGIGGGGFLATGNYHVRYAATDGTYFTSVANPGSFAVASPGDVWGLDTPPAIPFGCTGWTVWLSNDSGLSWRRYLHNVVPAFDVGYGSDVIAFSAALPVAASALPVANDFPILDPRIAFPTSMAALRDNATEQRLYISVTNPTTGFRRYMTGIVGATADLVAAFPGSGVSFPTSNTTARNIPRVTFPFGGYRTIVYTKSMTDRTCKSFTATASPKDLSGTPNGTACSNEINTTRGGHYDVTVQPPDSVPATGSVDILYGCFTAELSFGFCNYHIKLDVVDHDGAGAVAGWYVLGDSGHVTYDSDGLSVVMGLAPMAMTGCVFYANEESLLSYCREDTGGGTGVHNNLHHISVRAPGYWDRCINFNTPCTVPAPTWEFTVDMYSKANWVQNTCCGPCPEVPAGGLVPEMLPKHLTASFVGPEAMTGVTSPVTATVTYNPTRTAALGEIIYDGSADTGGWSWCMNASFADDYLCLRFGPDPYDPCNDPFPIRPNVAYSQDFYGSARMTWRPQANGCAGDLIWENFWGSGPDDDTPPPCFRGTHQGGIWCVSVCPCGEVRPDGHSETFVGATYGTKSGSTSAPNSIGDGHGPTTTGTTCSIVNWHQAQNPIIPILYNLCPDAPAPVCSGTVTES